MFKYKQITDVLGRCILDGRGVPAIEAEVLGEDGEVYIGNYGMGLVGNSFFRTREDQIKFLRRNIAINNANIFILQHRNSEYNEQIDLLTQKEEVQCSTRTLKK